MSLRTLAVGVALASSLVAGACHDPDPAVLSLDGDVVRRSDFEHYLARVEEHGLGPLGPEARRGLLESFLEEQALLIEARRRGLLESGATAEEEQQAVARLLAEAAPPGEVTAEEVRSFYEKHAAELKVPESVTLRQILVGTLNEARDLKRRLLRDPRSFETLARTRSKGPEAEVGGYMGTFERGQLPRELEEAAFALAAGRTSPPIETSLGYHVLKVDSRQPERELSLEDARGWIRERLLREKADAAARAFVAGLLSRARVNHEAALRTSSPSSSF
jgi:parvulin-like peptidyl-prolyl isomerase